MNQQCHKFLMYRIMGRTPWWNSLSQLLGSLLRQHESKVVQARGRTPARRRRHEGGDDQSPALTSMAADFTFVAGKYWRILVILMIHMPSELGERKEVIPQESDPSS